MLCIFWLALNTATTIVDFILSLSLSLADNLELLKKKLDMVEVHTTQPTITLVYFFKLTRQSPNLSN